MRKERERESEPDVIRAVSPSRHSLLRVVIRLQSKSSDSVFVDEK